MLAARKPAQAQFSNKRTGFVYWHRSRRLTQPPLQQHLYRALPRASASEIGKESELARAIGDGKLGKGSIAGDEYLYNMEHARVSDQGVATWVETCFCDPPLAEERPNWEKYFQLLSVKDAHSRRSCRHENGTEPWACCDCDCTKKLEERLATRGNSFLQTLRTRRGDLTSPA